VISSRSQVSPGRCVLDRERAPALNPELRRSSVAASCLSSTSAPRWTCEFADVQHGRVHGGHHDARLSGGPRLGQATSLRSVRYAAHGLDRTAAPPGARNYVMASRLTVAHERNESVHPRRSGGVMIRSRERRDRRPRRGTQARTPRDHRDVSLRALVRTLARQAARELFARELAARRQDRPEVTLQ
jgi:hypothetical protein